MLGSITPSDYFLFNMVGVVVASFLLSNALIYAIWII
jgi:hypothetical protein